VQFERLNYIDPVGSAIVSAHDNAIKQFGLEVIANISSSRASCAGAILRPNWITQSGRRSGSSRIKTTTKMTASEINVDRYLLHILLLLSADVEHNPGPNMIRKLNNIGIDTTPLGAEFLRDSTNGLKTAHVNTGNGGLIYHIDEIKRVISKYNLDILCVSETWVDNTHNPNEFGIDGYHFEHRDNNKTFQGKQGVGLFIKNNISYKPLPDIDPSDLMCMTIKSQTMAHHGNIQTPQITSIIFG